MSNVTHIHGSKTPVRLHFIPEWANHRNLKQSDITRLTGADKSLVSRWYSGTVPTDRYLQILAEVFATTTDGLFRHPDDDWFARFFRKRTEEERERAKKILEQAFPDRAAG